MIRLEGVRFRYRDGFALAVDDLAVEGSLALLGASGSGKSTLLRLIAGLLVPGRGRVRVGEVAVSTLGEDARRRFRLRHLALVAQDFALIDHLSALDNVLLPQRLAGALDRDARRRAHDAAERLAIAPLLARPAGALSHGERQRCALCRALVARPLAVLADEPTASLDAALAARARDELHGHCRDLGATLVIATHDPATAARCDRRLAMETVASTATPAGAAP